MVTLHILRMRLTADLQRVNQDRIPLVEALDDLKYTAPGHSALLWGFRARSQKTACLQRCHCWDGFQSMLLGMKNQSRLYLASHFFLCSYRLQACLPAATKQVFPILSQWSLAKTLHCFRVHSFSIHFAQGVSPSFDVTVNNDLAIENSRPACSWASG